MTFSVKSQYKPIPLYIQMRYVSILTGRLKLFKWERKDRVASCRCPLCGDSTSNKKKRSGYFYIHTDGAQYHCFRQCGTMSLKNFLKRYDETLHQELIKDIFIELGISKEEKTPPKFKTVAVSKDILKKLQQLSGKKSPLEYAVRLDLLPEDHFAKQYIIHRQIPLEHLNKLWFVENYKLWVHEHVNQESFSGLTEKQLQEPDPRVVIPFFSKSGKAFAYQGRYLGTNSKATRYITVKDKDTPESIPLIFGLDRVDLEKPVFVLEGPLDSLFVPNSVACAGTGLRKLLKLKNTEFVFCYDNQPRSPSVTKLVKKIIDDGYRIVIWNTDIKEKDVNEMVKANELSIDKISKQLYNMSYQGFEALIQYDKWKKI